MKTLKCLVLCFLILTLIGCSTRQSNLERRYEVSTDVVMVSDSAYVYMPLPDRMIFHIINNSSKTFKYCLIKMIEKNIDGVWRTVRPTTSYGVADISVKLEPFARDEYIFHVSFYYDRLVSGRYRIAKIIHEIVGDWDLTVKGSYVVFAEFIIKEADSN